MRTLRASTLAVLLLAVVVSTALPASAATRPDRRQLTAATTATAAGSGHLTVGSVTLSRCNDILSGAWCGSVTRAWDPTGAVPGTLPVGFAFLPAKDTSAPAVGTLRWRAWRGW